MMKVYALISAVILFVILAFAPFFVNQNATTVAVSWNTARTLVSGWTAGPGNWD